MMEKQKGFGLASILIVIMISLIYSNTLNSPWIFDDYHNIISNPKIQIKSLSLENLKGSLFSYIGNGNKLYRPVACFSFAMNALVGGKNVTGYHIVNIFIHILSSLILLRLFFMVFNTPAFQDTPEDEKRFVIIFSALLWAVNPVQIQAVTYIVQRMTTLCTMFSLLSFVLFIKTRTAETKLKQIIFCFMCLTSVSLSILSKENGILSIPLIICLEFFLFKKGDPFFFINKKFWLSMLLFILVIGIYFFLDDVMKSIENGYAKRPFTMYERILTEPNVLLSYLSLILYPMPQRFSLEHEIAISSGLFSPVQTSISIIFVVLIFLSCLFSRRIPLLARLAVVFFFVAHSIEASIIPLEIFFEHRNHLPSVFIFIPLTAGFYKIFHYYLTFRSLKNPFL